MEGPVWLGSSALLRPLDADRREDVEDGLSGNWCGDPEEWPLGIELTVEGEDEAVCRQEKRECCTQWIPWVFVDFEANRERALHGALEADAQQKAP